ncbi:MAG: TraR/DksA C4-type zinc finger protein [Patescibacteria group bacterium]|nr:TraR/DksA C4-type zinc finger protein [Patescibacteria group bacterium]
MANILPLGLNQKELEVYLINKRKQVADQLVSLEQDDPILACTTVEPTELGTESWQADVHAKSVALKRNLHEFSEKIEGSLKRIKDGTYGQCEKCGQKIDSARLQAIPIATLCGICMMALGKRV